MPDNLINFHSNFIGSVLVYRKLIVQIYLMFNFQQRFVIDLVVCKETVLNLQHLKKLQFNSLNIISKLFYQIYSTKTWSFHISFTTNCKISHKTLTENIKNNFHDRILSFMECHNMRKWVKIWIHNKHDVWELMYLNAFKMKPVNVMKFI